VKFNERFSILDIGLMMIEGWINTGPICSSIPTPWYAITYYGIRMLGKGGDGEEGVCGGVVHLSKPEI
ncbi:unnamed protein product, partial [Musa textilis]